MTFIRGESILMRDSHHRPQSRGASGETSSRENFNSQNGASSGEMPTMLSLRVLKEKDLQGQGWSLPLAGSWDEVGQAPYQALTWPGLPSRGHRKGGAR